MNYKAILLITVLAAAVIVAGVAFNSKASAIDYDGDVVVYKSMGCGCCSIYTTYLQETGKLNVRVENVDDIYPIKDANKIPVKLQSCHTTFIGDYFVEGHVPLEAISKLLNEKPDIAGIAMAGMPSGSPGMPGGKTGPFVIYSVGHDGSYAEFMRI